jgi:hypothetical protein
MGKGVFNKPLKYLAYGNACGWVKDKLFCFVTLLITQKFILLFLRDPSVPPATS